MRGRSIAKWTGIAVLALLTLVAVWSAYISEEQANDVAESVGYVVGYGLFAGLLLVIAASVVITPIWLAVRWWRRR